MLARNSRGCLARIYYKDGVTLAVPLGAKRWPGSGGPLLAVVQASQSPMRKDAARGHGTSSAVRCSLPESEMCAVRVVVPDVFRQQPLQMAFVDGNNVIQQITAATADLALRDAILPRTLERSPDRTHVQGSNGCRDLQPILRITVEDQKSGSQVKGKRFS